MVVSVSTHQAECCEHQQLVEIREEKYSQVIRHLCTIVLLSHTRRLCSFVLKHGRKSFKQNIVIRIQKAEEHRISYLQRNIVISFAQSKKTFIAMCSAFSHLCSYIIFVHSSSKESRCTGFLSPHFLLWKLELVFVTALSLGPLCGVSLRKTRLDKSAL